MKRGRLHLSKKLLLVALPVAVLAVGGVAFAALPDKPEPKTAVVKSEPETKSTPTEQETAQETSPAAETAPVAAPQSPAEPTQVPNPYPEGFEIWHAFNRRAEVGLTTPTGPTSDVTYWQGVHAQMSKTPTQYAIAFRGGTQSVVVGVVETINSDGSLVLSCTNCGQWNVLSQKQVTAEDAASYKYLQ